MTHPNRLESGDRRHPVNTFVHHGDTPGKGEIMPGRPHRFA
jgi:hypothetical protein